ncbi:MAG: hypothetical protein COX36_00310 [Candidatus Nealsonbacteria bacterium CG23_combo_of_CG06-09_8_20_14_all_38_19]|nr:MAG: hypothetical protein COX36_00310 [Candidatus Nealsonbacteria bacterium CG23_combo_of_CG06-09_8_20_14_all_38_19]
MIFLKKPMVFITAFLAALLSIVLHNLISCLTEREEPLFFIIALLSLLIGAIFFIVWLFYFFKERILKR